ncbi:MAG: acyl-CoA dehydrogenase family protein, partial [Boseongicola sp.]|nr:acyl-CoA dehydrogenase family protein [Boseongicola sp.]
MPHDGSGPMTETLVLNDLLALTKAAVEAVNPLLQRAKDVVRAQVTDGDRVSATLIEQNQTAAHGLAWVATYAESLRQMQTWAEALDADGKFGELEQLIHQITFGEYLWQLYGGIPMSQGEIIRLQDLGLSQEDQSALMNPAVMTLTQTGNTQAARLRLVEIMRERNAEITVGATGLDEELEMIREQFRRFAKERVEPDAHEWHLKDELIPMEIIDELAEMGVFGLTIPEEYGGFGLSKASMCVVSEELSRGYIGVGSLGTRSEIAAELIICGGTEAQKEKWLPGLAS